MTSIKKKEINPLEQIENPNLLLNFDLYTRNHYISDFINSYDNKKLKILDVGGRNGHLKDFLKAGPHLTIIDIRESENEQTDFILSSIMDNKLETGSFDVVTSSDFYEHIEKNDRPVVLDEMLRIAKSFVIIAAPFYTPEVKDAEHLVNSYYKKIHKVDHPWLAEHFESELPDSSLLEESLKKKKLSFYSIGTNNLVIWQLMQLSIFYLSQKGIDDRNLKKLQYFYNTNLDKLSESQKPTYRKIYFISKSGEKLNSFNQPNSKQELSSSIILLSEKIFETLNSIVDDKNLHTKNLIEIIESKDQLLRSKDTEIKKLHENLRSILESRSWRFLSKIKSIKNKSTIR